MPFIMLQTTFAHKIFCDTTIISLTDTNLPGFKSDHSIVTIHMHFTNEKRGP